MHVCLHNDMANTEQQLAGAVDQMSVSKKKAPKAEASGPLEFEPKPAYFDSRIAMFEKIKAEQDAAAAALRGRHRLWTLRVRSRRA